MVIFIDEKTEGFSGEGFKKYMNIMTFGMRHDIHVC